jgi:hypothetical protein
MSAYFLITLRLANSTRVFATMYRPEHRKLRARCASSSKLLTGHKEGEAKPQEAGK